MPTSYARKHNITSDSKKIRSKYIKEKEALNMLARLIYSEARGIKNKRGKAAVVWCVLNRVDNKKFPNTIKKVVTQKSQFAYSRKTRVKKEFRELALDVLVRWELEKLGYKKVGRVLPKRYLYFTGRRGHNWFRKDYRSRSYWNWSLKSPY